MDYYDEIARKTHSYRRLNGGNRPKFVILDWKTLEMIKAKYTDHSMWNMSSDGKESFIMGLIVTVVEHTDDRIIEVR